MNESEWNGAPNESAAWREHNLSQLRYFASLTLREKMAAVEGMADVVRKFSQMRQQGKFTRADAGRT
jgi:hypothetical protein